MNANATTITYVVIQPGSADLEDHEGPLTEVIAQDILVGPFEALPRPSAIDVIVLAAEEGKLEGRLPNWLATAIVAERMRPDDFIAGTAIVTGPPDEDGELTSISDEAKEAIKALGVR